LYCPKGNIKGRFDCNVCRAGVGCSETRCPQPDAVCSSTDGEGNAEISLTDDKESIRIIATVKKGQTYALALGSTSLIDSDLLVFHAKNLPADSFATDSRAAINDAASTVSVPAALRGVSITEEGDYIRFDGTRRLAPGTAAHFRITLGATHDMAWGQYADTTAFM
jgi:hypothetical protein